jgi:hypothetical protein
VAPRESSTLSRGSGIGRFAAKRARAKPVRSYEAWSAKLAVVRAVVLRIPARISPAEGEIGFRLFCASALDVVVEVAHEPPDREAHLRDRLLDPERGFGPPRPEGKEDVPARADQRLGAARSRAASTV